MHIVSREVYEAALLIHRAPTIYKPGHDIHETALASGIARVNGTLLELTHKGELVIRLE